MRKRLNVTSWMAGKEDILARFDVIEQQLTFEQKMIRRTMQSFNLKKSTGNVVDDLVNQYGASQ